MKHNDSYEERVLEVLDASTDQDFQERALHNMLCSARKRRRRKQMAAAVILLVMLLGLAMFFQWDDWNGWSGWDGNSRRGVTNEVIELPAEHPSVEVVSDDDLLESFPDRPVALVGSGSEQRLVFLDEL